jgi:tetratricopeptide (TPR) repeat protein
MGEPSPSAQDLYYQGRTLLEQGRFEEAVRLLGQSALAEPHFKTLELLGECLMALSRWHEAIVPLAAATTLNRGVRAPSLLAEAFLALRNWHDAGEMAELALARDPNNRRARRVKEAVAEHRPRV